MQDCKSLQCRCLFNSVGDLVLLWTTVIINTDLLNEGGGINNVTKHKRRNWHSYYMSNMQYFMKNKNIFYSVNVYMHDCFCTYHIGICAFVLCIHAFLPRARV